DWPLLPLHPQTEVALGMCGVFIDGGYLDKVCLLAGLRVDLQKLVAEMAGGDELLRAHYYHCMPYQSNPPTTEERERFAAMDRFMTTLRRLPRFEVRLGKLSLQGLDASNKPIFVRSASTSWWASTWRFWPARARSPVSHCCLGTATSSRPSRRSS